MYLDGSPAPPPRLDHHPYVYGHTTMITSLDLVDPLATAQIVSSLSSRPARSLLPTEKPQRGEPEYRDRKPEHQQVDEVRPVPRPRVPQCLQHGADRHEVAHPRESAGQQIPRDEHPAKG